jgi:hypothetical protein
MGDVNILRWTDVRVAPFRLGKLNKIRRAESQRDPMIW